ncbi:hypothetical protein [Streptomyces sp. f150]|uniref:hypothetical protein n=1 Tax=Streptomyces sp. f150 TaxID=1827699 RepID=UPI00117E6A91|nr:hypothetical protein [Streptomyces sp. f150]
MTDEQLPQPVITGLPLTTGPNGQPLIGCDAVVALLESIANVVERLASEDDPADLAAAIRVEADALNVRAIAHTTETP